MYEIASGVLLAVLLVVGNQIGSNQPAWALITFDLGGLVGAAVGAMVWGALMIAIWKIKDSRNT